MSDQKAVQNRMEILFLYETKDCNPNGDPLDENKPRTDPDTGVATVTDVRIKRTVRDYLLTRIESQDPRLKDQDILIRETHDEKGFVRTGEGRGSDFYKEAGLKEVKSLEDRNKLQEVILRKCVDTRLFGCTLPTGKKRPAVTITGPAQFSGFNRSLHEVKPQIIQISAAFASKEGEKAQRSLGETHLLPYALIAAYGVVNEVAARTTGLSEEDVSLLLEGLWKGTESLISRSKMGHQPFCLMRVRYRNGRRVGDLAGRLSLIKENKNGKEKEDTAIRSVEDYHVNAARLLDGLEGAKDDIAALEVQQDGRLRFQDGEQEGTLTALAEKRGFQPQLLTFG